MLVATLSTGHKIGLVIVAGSFILFALTSSFVAPRYKKDFPGKSGLSVFVIACIVLFAMMLTAVEIFGKESESKSGKNGAPAALVAPR